MSACACGRPLRLSHRSEQCVVCANGTKNLQPTKTRKTRTSVWFRGRPFVKGDARSIACSKEGNRVARLTEKFRGPQADRVVMPRREWS